VESTESSDGEDFTFLCPTACHSLMLLCSSLGLELTTLLEEGEI
jgi:hypothetical protein